MSQLPSSVHHVVCYLRKSREDEEAERRGEDTLAKQRVLMEQDVLCRYSFTYDLAEEVASGDSIRARPVFQSLLPKLGTEYQAIVCKDLSRLGRGSYSDMGIVYDIIRDKRVFVITKDAVYDPGNFSDLRMIRFSLFFNREEYEMTLWRLTEGKYDGAAKGKWVAGSVPFGFHYNAQTQNLEPNDNAAPIVRLIFNLYLQGHGYRAISKQLSSLGIRSPRGKRHWQPEVIRRLIRNPAYIGTLVFRRTKRNKLDGRVTVRPESEHIVVEDAFPGLVSRQVWESVQKKVRTQGSDAANFERRNPHTSELSGLIRCRQCRHTLVRQHGVQQYKQKTGKLSRYEKEFLYCLHCSYAVKYRSCEAQLLEVLDEIPFYHDIWSQHIEKALAESSAGTTSANLTDMQSDGVRQGLLERRQSLETRRARARELVLDGTFSEKDFQQVTEQIDEELKQLEAGLRRLSSPRPDETLKLGGRLDTPFYGHTDGHTDAHWAGYNPSLNRSDSNVPHSNHSGSSVNQSVNQRLKRRTAEIYSLAQIYKMLSDTELKNHMLRLVFKRIELALIERGRGPKRPSSFDLYVTLQQEWTRETGIDEV